MGAVVVSDQEIAPELLTDYCAAHLASYKVPEFVVFTDDLPFSALGKLDRKALRSLLARAPGVGRG